MMMSHTINQQWTLKDTVVMAVLGVVYGALYVGFIPVWGLLSGITGPFSLDIIYGVWFMASITAAYIIRKPGVAFTAEVLASLAEIPWGVGGAGALLGGLMQGFACEIPFAATRWRNYSTTVLVLSGMTASVVTMIHNWFLFGYSEFPVAMLATMWSIRLVSGALIAGLGGKAVADGLAATGALRSFPLGRERAARQVGRV